MMFDCIFYNDCGFSMGWAIRVLCIIYVIPTNSEVAFASKVCFEMSIISILFVCRNVDNSSRCCNKPLAFHNANR